MLEPITSQSLTAEPFEPVPPVGPGRTWTKPESIAVLGDHLRGRDRDSGRNLFHAASCAKCHRLNGEGGAIGPDLSTTARKYSLSDILDSILEPNKVISDQYGSHEIRTTDGLTVIGRVIEVGDEIHVFTEDPDAPPKVIQRSEVEEMVTSKQSQMPGGLVDSLNPEELKDLIAYVLSIGN